MKTQTTSKVIVYHDETGIRHPKLKGHALLFIPYNLTLRKEATLHGTLQSDIECRKLIYDKIMEVRRNHDVLGHKFHFSDIGGKTWTKQNIAERKIVDLGVDALRKDGPEKFNA